MSTPRYYLKVRTRPEKLWVTMWLMRADGTDTVAHCGLLWGEMLPDVAEAVAAALGLPVEREESPLANMKPLEPPGCAKLSEQSLFS